MGDLLLQSVVGAALVIMGVVIKNSLEQLNRSPSPIAPILFVLGWLIFGYAVAHNAVNGGPDATNVALPYIAVSLVALSVLLMKAKMGGASIPLPMQLLQLGFVVGWLLLAFSIGRHRQVAFASAILVLAAMMLFLPQQRLLNIVDGPGMPMFTAAWAGMIYANAL